MLALSMKGATFMDRFTIGELRITNEISDKLLKIERYLSDRFYIPFNKIYTNFLDGETQTLDELYKIIDDSICGLLLTDFSQMIYPYYTHSSFPTPVSFDDLEKQIKDYCMISILYSIKSSLSKDDFSHYIDILTRYNLKNPNRVYSPTDNKSADNFRNAFDRLYNETNNPPYYQTPKDTAYIQNLYATCKNTDTREFKKKILLSNKHYTYLSDALDLTKINTNTGSKRCINDFLCEFSYDMLFNSMGNGFNISNKLSTLSSSLKSKYNFNRQTKQFINKLATLNNSFKPYTDTYTTDDYMYFFKKEELFHTNALFKIILNHDIISPDLFQEVLAMPFLFDLDPICNLINHLKNEPIKNSKFMLSYINELYIPIYKYTLLISLYKIFEGSLKNIEPLLDTYCNTLSILSFKTIDLDDLYNFPNNHINTLGLTILNVFKHYKNKVANEFPMDNSFYIQTSEALTTQEQAFNRAIAAYKYCTDFLD